MPQYTGYDGEPSEQCWQMVYYLNDAECFPGQFFKVIREHQ